MEFEYPLREQLFQVVQGIRQLKMLLTSEALHLRISKQFFRISFQKDRYIYARCRACQSVLKFIKEDESYRLTSFNNFHRHQVKNQSVQIQSFIKSMPLTMTTQSLMQITTNTFKITPSKFYYHNQKLWSEKIEFNEVLRELDAMNYETRLVPFPLPQGELPNIFITASPEMIENFKKYGEQQFITFDVTYNLVKEVKIEKNQSGQERAKKWGLGMFLGKNCNNKAIPFAFCLLNTQTKDSILGIFKSFFEMMKGEPATIITDQQASIMSAIAQLKEDGDFQGYHLLDTFHILRNISKKSKNIDLLRQLRNAMFAKTSKEYSEFLEKARQICIQSEDIRIYKRFVDSSNKYCLSQIPVSFCGVSISTSYGEKVNDFVKTFIPTEKPFKVVIRKLLKIMKELTVASKNYKVAKDIFEEILKWNQLKHIRHIVCEPIYKKILQNYIESLSQRFSEEGDIWVVDDHQVGIKDEKLFCACAYLEKCGIPCTHLIKLIAQLHEDPSRYIHKRWLLQLKENAQIYRIHKGRSKKTRRNKK